MPETTYPNQQPKILSRSMQIRDNPGNKVHDGFQEIRGKSHKIEYLMVIVGGQLERHQMDWLDYNT